MTQREEFEKHFLYSGLADKDKQLCKGFWNKGLLCGAESVKAHAVQEGWKLVPVEPTSDQFGGMARDIIQWMRFTESKNQHSDSLVKWLKDMGNEIPAWLYSESEINHLSKHVISKGTIAAIIYKAMLASAPEQQK